MVCVALRCAARAHCLARRASHFRAARVGLPCATQCRVAVRNTALQGRAQHKVALRCAACVALRHVARSAASRCPARCRVATRAGRRATPDRCAAPHRGLPSCSDRRDTAWRVATTRDTAALPHCGPGPASRRAASWVSGHAVRQSAWHAATWPALPRCARRVASRRGRPRHCRPLVPGLRRGALRRGCGGVPSINRRSTPGPGMPCRDAPVVARRPSERVARRSTSPVRTRRDRPRRRAATTWCRTYVAARRVMGAGACRASISMARRGLACPSAMHPTWRGGPGVPGVTLSRIAALTPGRPPGR
ncbi:hypothetical protein FB559_5335 [Actinoallomurus bryophytorum]|uniref:Uncharacterized protein n=1 Tax=Actinoallomurus bryophytorum TaxID=1490222 RepID=A0A543CRT7_9ACTN|nr:hypothetical protein FB559_5335 [Actinoallomurus bryophytorum]